MKNPLNHITNYFTLRKLAKTCPTPGGYDMERLIEYVQRIYKKKNSMMRNLAAKAAKFQRIETPFVPKDYSKAKAMYDAYFQMENHIPSKEHLQESIRREGFAYIVKFRNEIPVKGNSYSSYYIDYTFGDNQIRKIKENEFSKWDALTSYRYATSEEIEMYEEIQRKIDSLEEIRVRSDRESFNASNEINDLKKLRNSQIN